MFKENMRIIAFIEDYKIVRKILDYLGIYEFKRDLKILLLIFYPKYPVFYSECINFKQIPYLYLGDPEASSYKFINLI